ncbi:hypothetical protein [Hymenobacter swuensis]|uniref:Uncharacterized protein n=1 Tax=Hymenobacter swuensis DY53 TaxID=1227739 RepID=W8ESN7_9BACT|nr:hypothetical protein [Hymenobacter swuensis]AHJ95538.1 hypothetical protein Hsw_PA0205 [Hymenobacter swuensis DY53]
MSAKSVSPATFKVDQIKFLESRVVLFRMDNQLDPVIAGKQLSGFDYRITTEQDMDAKKCIVRVRIGVVIQATLKDAAEKIEVGEIRTETVFKVTQLPKLLTSSQQNGSPAMPAPIGGTMIGLAYSTTRGQLLALGAGTILSRAFLPVVNPIQLLQNAGAEVKG